MRKKQFVSVAARKIARNKKSLSYFFIVKDFLVEKTKFFYDTRLFIIYKKLSDCIVQFKIM